MNVKNWHCLDFKNKQIKTKCVQETGRNERSGDTNEHFNMTVSMEQKKKKKNQGFFSTECFNKTLSLVHKTMILTKRTFKQDFIIGPKNKDTYLENV